MKPHHKKENSADSGQLPGSAHLPGPSLPRDAALQGLCITISAGLASENVPSLQGFPHGSNME